MRGGPSSPKQARTPTCRSRAVRCFSLCFGHDGRWRLHAAQEYKGYSRQDWQLGRQSTCVLATNRTCEPQSAAPLVLRAVFTQSCYARVPAAAQTRLSRILRCPLHLPPFPPPFLPHPAWGPDLRLPLLFLAGRKLLLPTFFPFLSPSLPCNTVTHWFSSTSKTSQSSSPGSHLPAQSPLGHLTDLICVDLTKGNNGPVLHP